EAQQLFRLTTTWGSYLGFAPAVPGLEYIGIRMLGMVALKGLDDVEVAEIVPFAPGEVEAEPIDGNDLVTALRQDFHQERENPAPSSNGKAAAEVAPMMLDTTREHAIRTELVICMRPDPGQPDDEVLIGEWDPRSDEVTQPLRLPRSDFQRLFSMSGRLDSELLTVKRDSVRDMYFRLCDKASHSSIQLQAYRQDASYDAFVIGSVVEKL
ncbi:MAG: hypothetical protein ABI837_06530, partial [Acidobacteriota bacterium]